MSSKQEYGNRLRIQSIFGYLRHVRRKASYDRLPQILLDVLGAAGVKVRPFLLFEEGLAGGMKERFCEESFSAYTQRLLTEKDLEDIASLDERNIPTELMRERLEKGAVCIALEDRGNLVTFTWYDMNECHFGGCRFPLKEDEAYLFDAHTVRSYRGRGVAPYARYHLYKRLARMGRTRFYSISDRFNTSAIRFKHKLGAKVIYRGLCLELFGKWRFSTFPEGRHPETP